jgi:hypothetical protein
MSYASIIIDHMFYNQVDFRGLTLNYTNLRELWPIKCFWVLTGFPLLILTGSYFRLGPIVLHIICSSKVLEV